jgi:hypothetical protein
MTAWTIVLVAIGALIAYLVSKQAEARKTRSAILEARFVQLSAMREETRQILERAAQRSDFVFQPNETNSLLEMRKACESLLPGLDKANPIMDRYFKNHIAIMSYVLGESSGEAGQSEIIKKSLDAILRSQWVERSNDPIAVMEKRLATGKDV